MQFRIAMIIGCLALAGCGGSAPSKSGAKPDAKSEAKSPPKITMFYASPTNPHKGEAAKLCYGVENAEEVTLDPPVDRVWPAFSRCIEISPVKATTYTFTARHGTDKVSQSVTVTPGPPALKLIEVSINKVEVARGEQVVVCFKAQNATSVDIKPGRWMTSRSPNGGCVGDAPQKDTTYVVTVSAPGGQSDSERVKVKVK